MPRKQVIYSSKSYEKDVKAIQDAESGKKPDVYKRQAKGVDR